MQILAWVAFIGFGIKAGAILISFGISFFNPEAAKNLYKGLDVYELRSISFWYYVQTVSFLVAIPMLKAHASYLVIQTLSKFNLKNPFTMEVVKKLESISYILLGTWVVTILSNAHTRWIEKMTGAFYGTYESGEFIFIVGLVYIFSQVFKRGVEIQSENELTI
jgi:hypothetical protein